MPAVAQFATLQRSFGKAPTGAFRSFTEAILRAFERQHEPPHDRREHLARRALAVIERCPAAQPGGQPYCINFPAVELEPNSQRYEAGSVRASRLGPRLVSGRPARRCR